MVAPPCDVLCTCQSLVPVVAASTAAAATTLAATTATTAATATAMAAAAATATTATATATTAAAAASAPTSAAAATPGAATTTVPVARAHLVGCPAFQNGLAREANLVGHRVDVDDHSHHFVAHANHVLNSLNAPDVKLGDVNQAVDAR